MRRKGTKGSTGWNARLVGLVLCAFFVLGMTTGFSSGGRSAILAASASLKAGADSVVSRLKLELPDQGRLGRRLASLGSAVRSLWPSSRGLGRSSHGRRAVGGSAGEPIALVEIPDGFYTLSSAGELRGPVPPASVADLPILSGRLEDTPGTTMVDYAALLVRAEVGLSRLVSEMRIETGGTASLFLDRCCTRVLIDLGHAPLEIGRARRVLDRWRGREGRIASLDMTTPDQAILRVHGVARMRRVRRLSGERREPKLRAAVETSPRAGRGRSHR